MPTNRIRIAPSPPRRTRGRPGLLGACAVLLSLLFAPVAGADDPPKTAAPGDCPPAAAKKAKDPLVYGVFPCGPEAVVDADTLRMPAGQPAVRILGIDAEEIYKSKRDRKASDADFAKYARDKRGDRKRPVKYPTPAGEAAKQFLIDLMKDVKQVRLERDRLGAAEKGTFGRRLAHAFLLKPTGDVNLAEAVIRAGHSPYFVKYGRTERYDALFRAAQKEAREAKRGIWGTEGPAHYPDYDERLAWWRQRAAQIERWKAVQDRPDHITLGAPTANDKLKARVGKETVLFGLYARTLTPRSKDRWILLLGHERRRGVPLVFFSKEVFDSLDRNAFSSLYLTVRGTLTLHKGLPQVVIERADQISTR